MYITGLLDAVASRDRVAADQDNVVGRDIGPSDGSTVFSLNGGYRFSAALGLAAGIGHVFDNADAAVWEPEGKAGVPRSS
jgi:iron complex outermembrane receptor protein